MRRGNYFSQYVKKFSLGNGPADWVAEYLVTKESGKMLGTLVALCVARMPNLESFVWDMGTGVLRDIWIALSVLGERQPCKLEKLWVRFHDNRAALQDINPASTAPQPPHAQSSQPAPAPLQPGPLGIDIGAPSVVLMKNHREEPNFSILPALRSLTVLDIDEVAYLDELSMLLERSLDKLRELRIGFAPTLYSSYYDPKKAPLKYIVMGGVISLLMSKINDQLTVDDTNIGHCTSPKDGLTMSEDAKSAPQVHTESTRQQHSHTGSSFLATTEVSNVREHHPAFSPSEAEVTEVDYAAIDPALVQDGARHDKGSSNPAPLGYSVTDPTIADKTNEDTQGMRTCSDSTSQDSNVTMPPAAGLRPAARTLKLETLEIEMVSLNVPILIKAIDSTMLTSLTLLDCVGTEKLWDLLTKDCSPRKSLVVSIPVQTPRKRENQPRLPRMPSSDSLSKRSHYPLKLRKIHVNTVSHQLIYFLKHTLAPDSLEWMFLQDSETFVSNVSLDAIYRGPLRRHRSSLNKLMVDSAIGPKGSRLRSASSRKWMVTREVLTFLTSGKMMRLRELAMTIQYKDWHFFLQRLPQIPHLRSLYVPCLADHPYRSSLNIRDCAMTALNVVALRPEVQLCYLGIRDKCFEILETKERTKSWHNKSAGSPNSGTGETDDDEDDDVGDHHDHDDDDSDVESPILATPAAPAAPTAAADGDSEHSAVSDDGDDDDGLDSTNDMSKVKLKLREILFYDDRISIFKARHGRL